MRVHSVQSWRSHRGAFELRRQQSNLPYPSELCHIKYILMLDWFCAFGLHFVSLCRVTYCAFLCVVYSFYVGNFVYFYDDVGYLPAPCYKWCWGAVLFLTSSLSEGWFVYLQSSLRRSLFIQRGGGLVETCGWLAWGSECCVSSWMYKYKYCHTRA